ncbi:MAG: type II toxin-antitoxin system YafQ family toxin [Rothia sp. (in: high G+C Gram-positive bacteria)]|nr:type II toxin-antitoxin system YafQ family toxin [Rothia sp. (in: high G+C Gram-positive bacteria)]
MYKVAYTNAFKKDVKKLRKRGRNLAKFETVLRLLSEGRQLPESYRDHALTGNWAGYRELHIEPDWLLMY